jgi:hypothetical protein
VHVAAYCPEKVIARSELPFAMRTRRDFDMAVRDPTKAARLVRWFMKRRRLGEYRVALQLADSENLAQRERGAGVPEKALHR